MMKPAVNELVKNVMGLVTLPDVFIRINALLENPDSTIAEIAGAVNLDPAFTARLLRVANSPFYGFSSAVDTVPKAVSVIGTSQIRNLALATAIASSFSGLPNSLVSMQNFWRHCLYCGLAARKLAREAGRMDADALFTAGLLHDIGELVIFNFQPEKSRQALMLVQDSADVISVSAAEQQVLGFDHAEVGGELAHQWKLPAMLAECIAFHHDILAADKFQREVAVVHIANVLAQMAEVNSRDVEDAAGISPAAWQIAGLDADEVMHSAILDLQSEAAEYEKLFFAGDW